MATTWLLHALYAGLLSGLARHDNTNTMTTRDTPDDVINNNNNNNTIFVTNTAHGKVRGKMATSNAGDVIQFLGIPYAKPPTGALRFERPYPPDPWTGDKDAFTFSPTCPQRKYGTNNITGREDCLYLNVYVPSGVDISTGPLSVMVWIHGGGYFMGAASSYDGSGLASHGVVVVTVNYRLGVLGFMSTEDDVMPGNLGMLDQILALEWVRQNIAAFGGDPNKVTIFGESAGASSVSLLMLSPLAKGLFNRAIMESGSSLSPWAITHPATIIKPRQVSHFIGNSVGCVERGDSVALLSCFRQVDYETLLKASGVVEDIVDSSNILLKPRVENTYGFLPDLPIKLLASGKFHRVNTIQGFNADEDAFALVLPKFTYNSMTMNDFRDAVLGNITNTLRVLGSLKSFAIPDKDLFVEEAKGVYKINATSDPAFTRDQAIQAVSNLGFVGPTLNEIKFFVSQPQPGANNALHFLYRFNYRPSNSWYPSWVQNGHGDELPFLFDQSYFSLASNTSNSDRSSRVEGGVGSSGVSDEDVKVSKVMREAWTNFAKTGDPNSNSPPRSSVIGKAADGGETWTPFSISNDWLMNLDSKPSMVSYGMPEVTSLSLKLIRKIDTAQGVGDWIVG